MSQWYDGFNLINQNQPSEASEVPLSLPPANEVWGKVIFLHLSVILFTGGGVCISLGRHPVPSDTMGYGQQMGSTHPTGMHTSSIT